jgi:hypothetical protein
MYEENNMTASITNHKVAETTVDYRLQRVHPWLGSLWETSSSRFWRTGFDQQSRMPLNLPLQMLFRVLLANDFVADLTNRLLCDIRQSMLSSSLADFTSATLPFLGLHSGARTFLPKSLIRTQVDTIF